MLNRLCLAFQFLTLLPTPHCQYREQDFAKAAYFYPLVGTVIGLALYGFALILPFATTALNSALLFGLWLLITGGLHWDGLADMTDAWVGGGQDKDKTLAIMKDPTAGPMAILVIVAISAIMLASIYTILQSTQGIFWFWLTPVIARTTLLLQLKLTPYAKPQGYGSSIKQQLKVPLILLQVSFFVGLSVLMTTPMIMISWVIAGGVVIWIHFNCKKRIQGLTGDVIGASIVLQECAILVCMALLLNHLKP
ncbi:MAG: adenosylcobinamide-GDP ribazoletransferase [Methylococcales bacterium]|jgi:adenosylcobinamide-GDP ribazoletransferase|nr:adenosylcobinamide-GDP ribazoletransferase [Methylococcales bacterium]MBT7445357.1 adenosylcobinamide-GDP ribazoletransferase [Methylococcales bacterium]